MLRFSKNISNTLCVNWLELFKNQISTKKYRWHFKNYYLLITTFNYFWKSNSSLEKNIKNLCFYGWITILFIIHDEASCKHFTLLEKFSLLNRYQLEKKLHKILKSEDLMLRTVSFHIHYNIYNFYICLQRYSYSSDIY